MFTVSSLCVCILLVCMFTSCSGQQPVTYGTDPMATQGDVNDLMIHSALQNVSRSMAQMAQHVKLLWEMLNQRREQQRFESQERCNDELMPVLQRAKDVLAKQVGEAELRSRPRDCMDVKKSGLMESGVRAIYPPHPATASTAYPFLEVMNVMCEQDSSGGGWTKLMSRVDNTEDFNNRTYRDYTLGFGVPAGSFWIGLETMHRLTAGRNVTLRFELEKFSGERGWAEYSGFYLDPASDGYRLHVANYSGGNAGDALSEYSNNQRFSAYDKDHDGTSYFHCAIHTRCPWWHRDCAHSCLNGEFPRAEAVVDNKQHIMWHTFLRGNKSLRKAHMMIRA